MTFNLRYQQKKIMRKFIHLVTAVLGITCFFNCQNDNDYESVLNIAPEKAELNLVKQNALDFANDVADVTRGSGKAVTSVYAWRRSDLFPATRANDNESILPDTMLYIVNFANNDGYALVNACSAYKEVVAYIESGNLTPDSSIENPGLQIFLNGLADLYANPMDSLYYPFTPDTTLFVQYPNLIEFYWYNIRSVSPMLKTAWGQREPFNKYINPYWNISCGVVAFGQILSKFRYPTFFNAHTYDWNEICSGPIPTTETGKDMAALLSADILSLTHFNIDYQYLQIGHDTLSRFQPTWNEFNYTWNYGNYDFNTCMNSLENNYPVMISGVNLSDSTAHIWVIDGGMDRCYGEELTDLNGAPMYVIMKRYKLVHCNWGWYGQDNGYFLSNAFNRRFAGDGLLNGSSHAYNSYPTMFYNIHPKKQN